MVELNNMVQFLFAIINTLILHEYLNALFADKSPCRIWKILCCLIFTGLQFGKAELTWLNPYISQALNLIEVLMLCGAAYSGKLYKKILFSIIYVTAWVTIQEIALYVISLTGTGNSGYHLLLWETASIILLFIMIRIIIYCIKTRAGMNLTVKHRIALLLLSLVGQTTAIGMFGLILSHHSSNVVMAAFYIAAAMVLINFFSYIINGKLVCLFENRKNNEYYEHQLRLCSLQAAEREEELLKVSELKHDIRNQLIYLREMTEKDEKEKLLDYLDNIIRSGSEDKSDVARSANIMVSTLVNSKYAVAKKHQIDLQVNVSVPYKLPYDEGDICIILNSALDNAIEDASIVQTGKRYIKLDIEAGRNVLTLVIKYPHNADKEEKKYWLTTVKKAVERYYGELVLGYDSRETSLTVILYAREPGLITKA